MKGFLDRFARHNAPFFVHFFQKLIEELQHLFPGSPIMATPVIFNYEGVSHMGAVSVDATDNADISATVTFLDAEGNIATVDEVPSWASDNEDTATVTADDDGMTAHVTPGNPGAAVISVTVAGADGDIVSQGTVTVIAGKAVTGDVEFSEASPEVNPL